MPFPTVSHFGLLTVVMVGGGVTAAATFAVGIEDPIESVLGSVIRNDSREEVISLNDEMIGRLFLGIDEIDRYSEVEDLVLGGWTPVEDGKRMFIPSLSMGQFFSPASRGTGDFLSPNLYIELLAFEGAGDVPFPGGGAHEPIPIPLPPAGVALAMGAAALGLSRRARVR